MEKDLREAALEYHRLPTPGKISVRPTKGLTNQRDLALAYSPGVAAACDAIVEDRSCRSKSLHRAKVPKSWSSRSLRSILPVLGPKEVK